MPPANSSREKKFNVDHFTILNEQILKYRSQGDIILCGDFNSRTGNLPDFIPLDQLNFQSDEFFKSNADRFVPPVRNTKDKIVNSYGRKLTDTCISHNLKIVNGRASGDLLGKYTCYNMKGSSTVDLFITSDALLSNIIQLKVSTPRFRSCHCIVNMTMKVDQLVIEEPTFHEFPPHFIWNNLYKRHFIEQLQNKDIIIQLDKLNNDIKNNTDIDYAVEKFKEIMLSVAEKSLPRRRSSTKVRKNTRKPNKKWFDHSCHAMKPKLNNLAKLLERCPNDPYVRGKLIATCKEYRKLIKRKNKEWQNLLIKKLQEFESSNPKEY